MTNIGTELCPEGAERGGSSIILTSMLVEGKYSPSPEELSVLLPQIDLLEKFKYVSLSEKQSESGVTFLFDSIADSHLFVLVVMERMNRVALCSNAPSDDFFQNTLLGDFRIDGWQLSYTEKHAPGIKIEGWLRYKYVNDDDKEKVGEVAEAVVMAFKETVPHLMGQLSNFSLR